MVSALNLAPLSAWRRRLIGIGIAALATLSPAHPEALLGADQLGAYQAAFAFSFALDVCGDGPIGDTDRRAIIEKLDHCPFTDAARNEFRSWAADFKLKVQRLQQDNVEGDDGLFHRLYPTQKSCKEQRENPGYVKDRALIERYGRGEISVDAFPFASCTPVGGL